MTGLMKLWLLIAIGPFAYLAGAVLIGATPGHGTDGFGDLAALIDTLAAQHGRPMTALFILILGCILAAFGLIRRHGSNYDGSGGGDVGWFGGDCGDGGGD